MTAEEIPDGKSALCRSILESLPDWFGIPESIDRYVAEVAHLPMLGVRRDGQIAGFITIETINPHVAEIHLIAVRQPYHRSGFGRVLVGACEDFCRAADVEILLVKTLAGSSDYLPYAAAPVLHGHGFRPCWIATFWDAENPCLLMGKVIGR
jgi:GNAT superfamily N-acetyltransferase